MEESANYRITPVPLEAGTAYHFERVTPPPVASPVAPEAGAALSLSAQALAGLPADTNMRATFQGTAGYWCQADAVFIPSDWDDAAGAIWSYRHRLASGTIGVSHNLHTDSIGRIRAEAEAAALRTQLAEAEEARKADLRGVLLEWKDSSEPDPTEFGDNTAMFDTCKAAVDQLFELKARLIDVWPLEEPASGIQEKGGAAA